MSEQEYKAMSIREFTKAAEIYDSGHAGLYEMCKDDYPPVLEELNRYPFQTLLDVGCGTGPMIELLLKEFPDKRCTGIDLTLRMIEAAQAKHLANAKFLVGDSEHLPFEAGPLMWRSARTAFTTIPTHRHLCRKPRVLKDGGRHSFAVAPKCAPGGAQQKQRQGITPSGRHPAFLRCWMDQYTTASAAV